MTNHHQPLRSSVSNIPEFLNEAIKLAGDITSLRTDEGGLYLAVVIDLWSRAVIGWSMSPRMTAQLACDALQMAWGNANAQQM